MKLKSVLSALALTMVTAQAMALDVTCKVIDDSSKKEIAPVTFTVNADDPRLVQWPVQGQSYKILTGRKLLYSTARANYYFEVQFSSDEVAVTSNVLISKYEAKDALVVAGQTAMTSETLAFNDGASLYILCGFTK